MGFAEVAFYEVSPGLVADGRTGGVSALFAAVFGSDPEHDDGRDECLQVAPLAALHEINEIWFLNPPDSRRDLSR